MASHGAGFLAALHDQSGAPIGGGGSPPHYLFACRAGQTRDLCKLPTLQGIGNERFLRIKSGEALSPEQQARDSAVCKAARTIWLWCQVRCPGNCSRVIPHLMGWEGQFGSGSASVAAYSKKEGTLGPTARVSWQTYWPAAGRFLQRLRQSVIPGELPSAAACSACRGKAHGRSLPAC